MKVKSLHPVRREPKVARNPLVISIMSLLIIPAVAESRVLFEESFDDLPDYTSSEELNLEGWDYRRNGEVSWSPSSGYPKKHDAFEILERNADKARGGSGKSFVGWRESYDPGWKQWNSDGILLKYMPEGYDQLYVSFYIRFSPEWTKSGNSKIFRIFSWNGEESPFVFFSDGNAGPLFDWKYSHSGSYGVRNFLTFRGGPHGENYKIDGNDMPGTPRSLINQGDISMNYTKDTVGMSLDGGTPEIRDQVNGGFISDNMNQTVTHEQIFGDSSNWTKMAFYVQMNSAPGANDGVVMQWINDELVFRNNTVNWVGENSGNQMVEWNAVALGGNDFFREYPNDQRYEEWYSIDDVVISTEIPEFVAIPNPPSNISIE
ncbi:hypothetical protein [Marinobacter sp. OP 3.4]|uniref:hypothetical protein n=1 Tax=Marinobacter sp. OP 3.4 TaxID=3076501 RepID=UPI002E1DFE02